MALHTKKLHNGVHEPVADLKQQHRIADMFVDGDRQIERVRTDNIFKQLDERQLTDEEQAIIQKRVELQRKLFQEFERRERHRKVQELQDVCPDLSKEGAEMALELCSWKEEEAAVRFTSDPLFKKRVLASSGNGPNIPEELTARLAAVTAPSVSGTTAPRSKAASIPRPRLVDAHALQQGHVFVGAFKGRLGPTQMAQQAQRLVDMGILRLKPGRSETQKTQAQAAEGDSSVQVYGSQQVPPGTTSSEPQQSASSQEQQHAAASTVQPITRIDATAHEVVGNSQPEEQLVSTCRDMQSDSEPAAFMDEDADFEWGPSGIVYSQQGGQDVVRVCMKEAQLQALVERAVQECLLCKQLALQQQRHETQDAQADPQPHVVRCASHEPETDTVVLRDGTPQPETNNAVGRDSDDTDSRTVTASPMHAEDVGMLSDAQGGCPGEDAVGGDCSDLQAGQQGAGSKRKRAAKITCSSKRGNAACDQQRRAGSQGQDDDLCRDSEAGKYARRARTSSRISAQRAAAAVAIAAAAEAFSEDEEQKSAWQAQALLAQGSADQQAGRAQQAGSQASRKAAVGTLAREPSPGSGSASAQTGRCSYWQSTTLEAPDSSTLLHAAAACGTGAQTFVTLGSVLLATKKGTGSSRSAVAISARGHTNRGRVKQKGAKRAELLCVGTLLVKDGWFNAGYIFPQGFKSRTLFRSSVELAAVCVHECTIVGEGGAYWPLPTFQVTAMDRPAEPLVAKSCTGCWSQALKRINSEIERRRAAGEDLPPAPKTAIAGPEYFGFNQPEVIEAVEALDPQHRCAEYWVGKEDRSAMLQGMLPVADGPALATASHPTAQQPASASQPATGARGRGKRAAAAPAVDVEDAEDIFVGNRWNAIDRAQRYKRRCGEDTVGGAGSGAADEDHPLPGFLDPITLELVVNPAFSPYGHVMGLATWKAVLAEHKRCPFTKQPLRVEQLVSLTKHNIERYRDRIIQQ